MKEDLSKFKVGDRVHIKGLNSYAINHYGNVGRITSILPDGRYEIVANEGGKYVASATALEIDAPIRPFQCCECVHFELCRSMFGNAGKLPCDFDDYFEARDDGINRAHFHIPLNIDCIDIDEMVLDVQELGIKIVIEPKHIKESLK